MPRLVFLAALLAGFAAPALAGEFRAVDAPVAILYDSPSQKGRKLFLIREQTPVEVVVRIEGWAKVRDADGALAWIEAGKLAERRNLVVTAPQAPIRQADNPDAPVVAELAKGVAVEWQGAASAGWVRVRHRDGAAGFMHVSQVWGL